MIRFHLISTIEPSKVHLISSVKCLSFISHQSLDQIVLSQSHIFIISLNTKFEEQQQTRTILD